MCTANGYYTCPTGTNLSCTSVLVHPVSNTMSVTVFLLTTPERRRELLPPNWLSPFLHLSPHQKVLWLGTTSVSVPAFHTHSTEVLSTFGWSAATSPVLLPGLPHLIPPLACSSCTQTPYVQLVHMQNTDLAIHFVASSPHSSCSCPPSHSFWPAHSCPLTLLLLHTSSTFPLGPTRELPLP